MPDRRTRLASISLSLVAGVALALTPAAAAEAQEPNPGQAIFLAQKCNMCHDVSSAAIVATTKSEKMKGPDLTKAKVTDPAVLGPYLRLQSEIEGKKHKKEFKGTDAELKSLIDWLVSQHKPG